MPSFLANQTFKFVNQGEFGDRIIEYDASYRVIRNDVYTFFTFPFRLCFYNTTPDNYIFAIRAGVPGDESLMRWVWDANRNNPAHENSTLTFGRDGNFVLAEADGRVVWQTNTANKGVTGIKLLPNGNLVLHDKNGKFIWQSFDTPLTPSCLVFDKKGLTMYINNSGKLLQYGGWPGDDFGTIVSFEAIPENDNATAFELVLSAYEETTPTPPPPGRRRLLQVSYLKWDETFAFFSSYFIRECALPSKCGSFGLCNKGMCVACPSPKGLLGWSESCAPPRLPPCKGRAAKVDYYKIIGVENFLNPYLDDGKGPMKVEECRERCSRDCKCLGFIYKEDTSKCLLAPLLATLIKDENATSVGYIKYS
ncbi:EP1-like glycoprotein 2 [Vitis vinifera]|uniref:EP1-like glycoprotein 2 n=1 Tax=Vitis vinifera TaxID=29760 RepID=A0A438J4P8_VITVI|nr:EP1-like glycoprotein 2 [Vitis vinifera]